MIDLKPFWLMKFYEGAWRLLSRHKNIQTLRRDAYAMRRSNSGIELAWTMGKDANLKGIPERRDQPAPSVEAGPIIWPDE